MAAETLPVVLGAAVDILESADDETAAQLAQAEAVIRRGLQTFWQVGRALTDIRDEGLYRARGYDSFTDYCAGVWGWTYQRAHQMIQAAAVVDDLVEALPAAPTSTRVDVPQTEAQARVLVPLSRDERQLVAARVGDFRNVPTRKLLGIRQVLSEEFAVRRAAEAPDRSDATPTPTPPLSRPVSVVDTDQDALTTLLGMHAVLDPRILDVTHNRGVMWHSLPYHPHRVDADPDLYALGFTDTVADFRDLPFPDATWDVLVFDPPHLTDSGHAHTDGFAARYGLADEGLKGHDSVAHLFPPFLAEAARVLVPGGVVLAKIADQVHQGAYQAQHIDLVVEARAQGWTLEDVMITVHANRGSFNDPSWKRVLHVRGIHCFWLVMRTGGARAHVAREVPA